MTIETLAPLTETASAQEHYRVIHTSGALMGKSSKDVKRLESFSIDAPSDLGEPETEGTLKGLYEQDGNWYAKMAGEWFEVSVEGDQISIVRGTRTGPPLVHDDHGQWIVDSRLRLRGSGSKAPGAR
ncbi:hypothetical protein THH46_31355 [Pseudomonas sp. NA13]